MTRYLTVIGIAILAIVCRVSAGGNPHDIMTDTQGAASQCLECKLSDKLNLAECLIQGAYEQCQSSRPECMTQLWWWQDKLVFVSECQQIEACIQESLNEPNHNQCDEPPIYVSTKCRYCCDVTNVTNGYYCPPPRSEQYCAVCGDPIFMTFDGERYHEGGDCLYTLMQMYCGPHDIHVQMYESQHLTHWRVSSLVITEDNQVLEVGVNNGVDPVVFTLDGNPVVFNTDHITIGPWGTNPVLYIYHITQDLANNEYEIRMDTDLDGYWDLIIDWKFKKVELTLWQLYPGCFEVQGLCGNANGNKGDYMTIRDGTNATNYEDFHEGWGMGGSCPTPLP